MARPIAPDPAIGIWKLNLAKSSFRLVPTPSILKIEPRTDGLKVSAASIDAHGNTLHPAVVYRFDGKDHPLVANPIADTVSARRINELSSESTWKRNRQVVLTIRIAVSEDGRMLTMTRTEVDGHGRMGEDLIVYDKQRP